MFHDLTRLVAWQDVRLLRLRTEVRSPLSEIIIYKSFIRHYDSKLNKNRIINNNTDVHGPIYK